ncbi:hypothetical protein B0H63DRAFT_456853 [Podospora didyma]|uniref:Zn(2)-C6 fungal-type domain-containing protein n=1 Tax=Podospora didyma TaxID=330526 RepID=A0AAE0P3T1_9PEZI|nr:hypothetical protein B0H63DRAFT_456853 [Podospora didyma]
MKVKQKSICETCRKQKIPCDGTKPSCSQCRLRDLCCPGYQSDWIFVPHTAQSDRHSGATVVSQSGIVGGRKRIKDPRPNPKYQGARELTVPRVLGLSVSHLMTLIIRSYVPEPELASLDSNSNGANTYSQPRICGCWVEVLPNLIAKGETVALSSAVRAFAVSILSGGPMPIASLASGLEAYSVALRSLQRALRSACQFRDELAAAIMCILLAELLLPTTLNSWAAHLQGFGELMQLSGPELYTSGIGHKLFVGARPSLVILGFLSRKASFLGTDEWRCLPFGLQPPSAMQQLLSEAAVIPSILERLDKASGLPPRDRAIVDRESLHDFVAVLGRLGQWETYLQSADQYPLSWVKADAEEGAISCRWFNNITDANVLTHFWAFKVICLQNIDELAGNHPGMTSSSQFSTSFRERVGLSVMISQSIGYLMQDEMKLFGPSSVIMPLRTAYDTFRAGSSQCKVELRQCNEIISGILERGYHFVPLFFEAFRDAQFCPMSV